MNNKLDEVDVQVKDFGMLVFTLILYVLSFLFFT